MPIAAPRCLLPTVVITISVPSKTGTASECCAPSQSAMSLRRLDNIRSRDLSLRVGPTMSSRQRVFRLLQHRQHTRSVLRRLL